MKDQGLPALINGKVVWPYGMKGRGKWRVQEEWERAFIPLDLLDGTPREIYRAKSHFLRTGNWLERMSQERISRQRAIAINEAAGFPF